MFVTRPRASNCEVKADAAKVGTYELEICVQRIRGMSPLSRLAELFRKHFWPPRLSASCTAKRQRRPHVHRLGDLSTNGCRCKFQSPDGAQRKPKKKVKIQIHYGASDVATSPTYHIHNDITSTLTRHPNFNVENEARPHRRREWGRSLMPTLKLGAAVGGGMGDGEPRAGARHQQ